MTFTVAFKQDAVVPECEMVDEVEGDQYDKGAGCPNHKWYSSEGKSCITRFPDIDLPKLTGINCILDPVLASCEVGSLAQFPSDIVELLSFFELPYAIGIGIIIAQSIQFDCPLLCIGICLLGHYLSVVIEIAILPLGLHRQIIPPYLFLLVNSWFESFEVLVVHLDLVDALQSILLEHLSFFEYLLLLVVPWQVLLHSILLLFSLSLHS